MRVRLAIGLGLFLVVGSFVIVLSKSEQRLAASNSQVSLSGNDVRLPGHKRACQPESVPAQTAALRVFVGGSGGPLDVDIRQGKRIVAQGSFGAVLDGLPATARLSPPLRTEIVAAEVCFRNRGRKTVRFAGDRTPIRFSAANPYGLLLDDEPRIDSLRPGEESGWELAGTVAERFGRAKASFFGSWTIWAVLGLVGATWAVACGLMLRRLPG
jgi:hypothetical protein